MKTGFLLVGAVVLLGGCVSTGTYDKKVAELSACQDERLALQDKAKNELDANFVAQQKHQLVCSTRVKILKNCFSNCATHISFVPNNLYF